MSAMLKPDTLAIRPMLDEDLEAVHGIEQRAYEFPWSVSIFSDCLRVGYCCWVLETDTALAGYGIMSVAVEESHILNVCVAPEARRQGFARAMMSHLLFTGAEHGARIAYLEVRPSNAGALKMYIDLGFRHVGTRRAYYPAHKGREDAFVLSLPLVPKHSSE